MNLRRMETRVRWENKYQIPNTTLTNILANCKKLRRMKTRVQWEIKYLIPNTTAQKSVDPDLWTEEEENVLGHFWEKFIVLQSHTVCICSTFLPCGLSYVSSSWMHHGMHSHIGCICLTCPYCGFLNVSSYYPLHRNPVTGCIIALAAFVWFFSTVRFRKRSQISCLRWCIVTLIAFVWLFSAMLFKMTSQAAFHRGWKLTFVALVCFFSFIIYVSQWNISIDPIFAKVIHKISIHHHQVANVVSCVLSVSNWENVDKKREQMKVKVIEEKVRETWKSCKTKL